MLFIAPGPTQVDLVNLQQFLAVYSGFSRDDDRSNYMIEGWL